MVSVFTAAAGQFFLKSGALKLGHIHTGNVANKIFSIFWTPELLLGLTCYGMGAISYILLLNRVKLTVAAPSIAIGYIFPVLIGYFVFREPIPTVRIVGMFFIVAGVLLIIRDS